MCFIIMVNDHHLQGPMHVSFLEVYLSYHDEGYLWCIQGLKDQTRNADVLRLSITRYDDNNAVVRLLQSRYTPHIGRFPDPREVRLPQEVGRGTCLVHTQWPKLKYLDWIKESRNRVNPRRVSHNHQLQNFKTKTPPNLSIFRPSLTLFLGFWSWRAEHFRRKTSKEPPPPVPAAAADTTLEEEVLVLVLLIPTQIHMLVKHWKNLLTIGSLLTHIIIISIIISLEIFPNDNWFIAMHW